MEKDILLNDDGLKVKCILEEGNVYFEFDKSYEFLNGLLKTEKSGNLTFVYLGLKKILRIENDNIERILTVSNTEVRILRSLYENNKMLNSLNLIDSFNVVKNNIPKSGFGFKLLKRSRVKTESHTYLTEILEAIELIRFLNEYDISYPMNEYGMLDFNSDKYYTYEQVKYNGWAKNLENSIRVNLARKITASEYNEKVKNREQLLKLACTSLEEMLGDTVEWKKIESDIKRASDDIIDQIKDIDDNMVGKTRTEKKRLNKGKNKLNEKLNKLNNLKASQAAKILYNELLNISLDKLTNEKAGYSYISFSNDTRLEFMSKKHPNDKRFIFLYSIDQNKNVKKFEDYSKNLESLINTGMVIGAEISGFEELNDKDIKSLKEKLECVLPVLRMHPDSILRIKAYDFNDASENICIVLKTIREVFNKINESCVDLFGSEWGLLNPPSIHICYNVRIDDNPELASLIKAFDACIEYNLNSNKALKGINDYSKVSLSLFDKNNIKYVYSTDGNGMYYTDYNEDLVSSTIESNTPLVNEDIDVVPDTHEETIVSPVKPVSIDEVVKKPIEPVKYEPVKEEATIEEQAEEDDIIDNIEIPYEEVDNNKGVYKEEELEQTLYDIFADLRKENKTIEEVAKEMDDSDNYQSALEEENLLFTVDGKLLSESEKVDNELSRLKELFNNNLDMDYINNKVSRINELNKNSHTSDNAKMYLFLLEREMFPTFKTNLKSIEYLYNNKDKEKDNIERELGRIFNLVTEEYDHNLL